NDVAFDGGYRAPPLHFPPLRTQQWHDALTRTTRFITESLRDRSQLISAVEPLCVLNVLPMERETPLGNFLTHISDTVRKRH
ncbi:MAG: hypothetical protein JXO22_13535, partial [Phycisphaerae bacterium]|nr:hypothetical protein [Phycisphaerae bacterium]